MKLHSFGVAFAAFIAGAAAAAPPLELVHTWVLDASSLAAVGATAPTRRLALDLVTFRDTRWQPAAILAAVRGAATVLAQCSIQIDRAELRQFDGGPPEYRYLDTLVSRRLARRLQAAKPAVFFVEDTRRRPAFDAEAFGRGNTRRTPELTHTVWITAGARDLSLVLAHELVHVLADSGEHLDASANLMGDETRPDATRLTAAQCARIVETGTREGLLRRLVPAPDGPRSSMRYPTGWWTRAGRTTRWNAATSARVVAQMATAVGTAVPPDNGP